MSDTYSTSYDGEHFMGEYESLEAAIVAGINPHNKSFWVGINRPPQPPESVWCADYWIEDVCCQDDYMSDAAEDWDGSTKEQREELEAEVRKVMSAWLDRHELRPRHFCIEIEGKYSIVDGVAVIDE